MLQVPIDAKIFTYQSGEKKKKTCLYISRREIIKCVCSTKIHNLYKGY